MIGYLEGRLLKKDGEKILLIVNGIGYEILIPGFLQRKLDSKKPGDELILYVYYQQTERQPKPVLIGFETEEEKNFFQNFISVEDVGALKAVKAMDIPINEIASAIESKNVEKLKLLKGIGDRTAKKIIASLSGRMEKFTIPDSIEHGKKEIKKDLKDPVMKVLITRLGHKFSEADKMIEDALKRNPDIVDPEDLFDEIYKNS